MRRSGIGYGIALIALPLSLLAARPVAAASVDVRPTVSDIRVGQNGATTRIVLDMSQSVRAEIFTLADPYRVVIDLPEVGWRLPTRPLPAAVGLFDKIRYGLFKPGTTRVVVDARGPVRVAAAGYLVGGDAAAARLVVDLVATSRQDFLVAMRDGHHEIPPDVVKERADTAAADAGPPVTVAQFPFALPPRKPATREKPLIVLDPGHGGIDPGAISPDGVYEKNITLKAAREFRQMLEATGRYRVKLTRDRDVFVPLRDRVAFARRVGANLFISLHADSIHTASIRGLSVYTLSERASDKEAAELADSENKVDLISGINLARETPEVTNILIDLAQRETMNESSRFASELVGDLGEETEKLPHTHRFAGFRVLKAPDVPSVLIEMGYLSNSHDEKDLLTKSYRAKLGAALVRAVDQFFARVQEASRS